MLNAKAHINAIRAEIEASSKTRLGRDSVNMLNTVSESVFSRSAHFILELLQNAEDAGPKAGKPDGDITFSISPERIRVTHNGTPFTDVNADAICGVRSSKQPELGTLGFLGIGFKSVFKVTDCPHIYSGDFQFKFDRSEHDDVPSVPWQIVPIWIETPVEPFDRRRTTFVLPFRSPQFYQQTLDELRKLDVHAFLFLKWLRRLTIIDESDGRPTVIEHLDESNGILTVRKDDATQRFFVCRRSADVPPNIASDPVLVFYKRQHVTRREVVVAFALDALNNLQTIEDASALGSVSSFLPLVEERSGAKFLIQADFLVQPGREAIQYELAWNRWLVGEAVAAVKTAVDTFKADPRWSRQFLPLFNFTSYGGQLAFDTLFGPHLKRPVLDYLRASQVVPLSGEGHVRAASSVYVVQEGLQGLLTDTDLPLLFGGRGDLRLVDPTLDVKSLPPELQAEMTRVDVAQVARHQKLLQSKVGRPEWFQQFYAAMRDTPDRVFKQTQRQGKRGRIESVDDPIYVVTDANEITLAAGVYLGNVPEDVLELRKTYAPVDEVLRSYTLLHPCLDSPTLNDFFVHRTHVAAIDYEQICRSVFLPKMRVGSPKPHRVELLAYTRLLQKGPSINEPIWVLTNRGEVESSDKVFMGTLFGPAEDWQRHAHHSPQIDFLSDSYLDGVARCDVPRWKDFFQTVSVKDRANNTHVEMFAMAFVEDQLSVELTEFVAKNRQQVGYDREARRKEDGVLVKLEIKGHKQELPVQLVGNEPEAAKVALKNAEPFWVCVVPGIPEAPQLWIVEDALSAGRFDTLKIDVSQWKLYGRRPRAETHPSALVLDAS